MLKGLLASLVILVFTSVVHAEEIYCNSETSVSHCGDPFFQMVSDGDYWKFMFISPDMSNSFQSTYASGESFLAIHFEIPKQDCTLTPNGLGDNTTGVNCPKQGKKFPVVFQGVNGDLEQTLWIDLSTGPVFTSSKSDAQTEDRVSLQLSDEDRSAVATGIFTENQCWSKAH